MWSLSAFPGWDVVSSGEGRDLTEQFSLQGADGHFSVLPSGSASPQQRGSWEGWRDRDAAAGSVQGVLHHRYCVPSRDCKIGGKNPCNSLFPADTGKNQLRLIQRANPVRSKYVSPCVCVMGMLASGALLD